MTEEKPKYILKPGQPPLKKKYNQGTVKISVTVTESMHRYIMDRDTRGVPASEYLRRLIAADMEANQPGPWPE